MVVGRTLVPFWEAPDSFAPWFSGHFRGLGGCHADTMLEGFPLGQTCAELAEQADDGVITSHDLFPPPEMRRP